MTTYPGGKNGSGVYQWIINQMPPHSLYVEAFLGMGAILRHKRPAPASIGIDADVDVLNAWNGDEVTNLTLIHGDAVTWLEISDLPTDALVYLDPPYLLSTRRQQRPIYRCELLTESEHARLLGVILGLGCMVAISGYRSDLYADLLAGWRMTTFQTITRGGSLATECLWTNYPEPFELHDYRYLGKNFRERESIKKQQRRWRQRLAAMTPLKRYALLSVIQEAEAAQPGSPASPAVAGQQRQPRRCDILPLQMSMFSIDAPPPVVLDRPGSIRQE